MFPGSCLDFCTAKTHDSHSCSPCLLFGSQHKVHWMSLVKTLDYMPFCRSSLLGVSYYALVCPPQPIAVLTSRDDAEEVHQHHLIIHFFLVLLLLVVVCVLLLLLLFDIEKKKMKDYLLIKKKEERNISSLTHVL